MEITLRVPNLVPPPSARPPVDALTPEEVLALHDELLAYHGAFAPLFRRSEQRHWALKYLEGQLLPLERTSIEPLADALVGGDVQALQQFISLGAWDDDAVLAKHQQFVAETLGDLATGVLIVDGCDCPKQGTHSVGVARHRPGGTRRGAGQSGQLPGERGRHRPEGTRPAPAATRWSTAACMSTRTGSPRPTPPGARGAACPPTSPSRRARNWRGR